MWDAVRHVVPAVERTGLDEGYLDMSDAARDFLRARRVAEAVQAAVRGATSLRARSASPRARSSRRWRATGGKPGGLLVVPAGREAAFLAPFDVRKLSGVGPGLEQRLRGAGLETIGQLAALEDADLRRLLPGKAGRLLRDRARGIDPRGLEQSVERISASHEETFEQDVGDRDMLHAELRRMSERLANTSPVAARRPGRSRRRSGIRTSRSAAGRRRLPPASTTYRRSATSPATCSTALRDRAGPLRLVGVAVSNIEPFRQLALTAP